MDYIFYNIFYWENKGQLNISKIDKIDSTNSENICDHWFLSIDPEFHVFIDYQSQFKSKVEDHGSLMMTDSYILSDLHCAINAVKSIIRITNLQLFN